MMPVKLSRERWDLLGRAPLPDGTIAGHRSLTTTAPIEIDGVTFLPAEYVPANEVAHPSYADLVAVTAKAYPRICRVPASPDEPPLNLDY